jgi:polar amino acid transport system substrate-binding protein
VGFVGIDRAEKVGLGFSRPFMQLEFTYLVPAGSSIRSAADVDRTGVRIAAVRSHLSTVALTPILKHATLVYAETPLSICCVPDTQTQWHQSALRF